ncbi:uncharacterized protein LOC143557611 [Bidens hawaiensis]|uniref:uncharacterized protein LOC143557611 n=1 Tax=Bidens hawaiensis TaxID=980011 RepID=UPI0040493772
MSSMEEIQDIFHPYMTHIQVVKGDGHCGFRAIAVTLEHDKERWPYIRNQLLGELCHLEAAYRIMFHKDYDDIYRSLNFVGTGEAPFRNWMVMPDTGILIANRFGVTVNYLSKNCSCACFPLWVGHEDLPNHQKITVALVHGNHYILVQLEGEYPMPNIAPLWTHYKNNSTIGWQTMHR